MADGQLGESVILLADTGGGTFEAVGGETDLTHDFENNMIDVTAKSNDHMKDKYGKKNNSLSLTALIVLGDAAREALEDAARNQNTIKVRREESGSAVAEADAKIESFSKNYPDQDSSEFSMEISMQQDWQTI